MKLTTKQLTLCAVLTAMALALSYLENLFPLSLAIPLPGIKLGLANIVTVFALYALGPGQALLILVGRCLLGAVFAGNMNALIFSVLGGVSAMLVMILLSRPGRLSVYGVSIGGAAAHNCGQIAAAVLTLWSTAPAGLSAGAAGSLSAHRGGDRRGGGLPVPGPGPHRGTAAALTMQISVCTPGADMIKYSKKKAAVGRAFPFPAPRTGGPAL